MLQTLLLELNHFFELFQWPYSWYNVFYSAITLQNYFEVMLPENDLKFLLWVITQRPSVGVCNICILIQVNVCTYMYTQKFSMCNI